jgi:pyruvate formate lyase activating enzyme
LKRARFWEAVGDGGAVQCRLCPHECRLSPGGVGTCGQRENRDGTLFSRIYARATTAALDPIEKKPLYHFMPGSAVLSLGTVGCNFKCPFCQNWSISQVEAETEELLPEAAVGLALRKRAAGIAYTYNEPMIWLEYVIDTARLAREKGLVNVLVTNGYVQHDPLAEALEWIDALNVDVKSFDPDFYRDLCKGRLEPVLACAEQARAAGAHVEITNLIIPGYNDRPSLCERLAEWVALKLGPQTPLHFSAHFPRYRLKAPATGLQTLLTAREAARKHLDHVYLGNVNVTDGSDTCCRGCQATLVSRSGYEIKLVGLDDHGRCSACGSASPLITAPPWKERAKD